MKKVPSLYLQQRVESQVTILGIVINLLLAASKISSGIIANSSAIIADGLHSISDLASDIAVLWGIRAAKQPPDHDHHYGHFRYETLVAFIVGILLIGAALFIAYESIINISQRHTALHNWLPLYIALASIVLKELLYWLTRAVGKKYHNQAILANAWHHRSDALSSIAAALGIAGSLIGGENWYFLDHLTAVLLASLLIFIGIRILRQSFNKLSDRAPDPQTLQKLHQTLAAIPGVKRFHSFRARSAGSGNKIEMDVHLIVDPAISVQAGHEIATNAEQQIKLINPDVISVIIHIEPEQET
ncbi:MAG: cation diffusion facilitator family transporter [bacterium]